MDEWTRVRSTLLVAATGLGKSRMGAEIIARRQGHGRTLWLAHRTELLDQAQSTIKAETGLAVGREQAGRKAALVNLWGASDRVVVASIQTMHDKRLRERFKPDDFATIIIDEAHHAIARQYRDVLSYFANARVLGVTATPDRADEIGLGAVFDTKAYQIDIKQGINLGFLCPLIVQEVTVEEFDIRNVKVTMSADSGKDLNASQLGKALELDGVMHQIAGTIVREAGTRQTIIFTPSVESAHHLASIIRHYTDAGVRAIDGTTAHLERVGGVAAFQLGRVQFLVNCAVFTEGFDAPGVACVALVRPTKSRALKAQMIGRGTRVAPGKENCLVLDFVPGLVASEYLVTPADVLAGRQLPSDIAKEVRRLGAEGMPALEALEVAEADKAARQEAARIREEARRDRLRIQTDYQLRQVDPFGVLTESALQGAPMKPRTAALLDAMHIDLPRTTSEKAARNIIAEVNHRRKQKLCTYKQAKLFARYGLTTQIPFAEASAIIDAIKANGWQNPPADVLAKWRVAV